MAATARWEWRGRVSVCEVSSGPARRGVFERVWPFSSADKWTRAQLGKRD